MEGEIVSDQVFLATGSRTLCVPVQYPQFSQLTILSTLVTKFEQKWLRYLFGPEIRTLDRPPLCVRAHVLTRERGLKIDTF